MSNLAGIARRLSSLQEQRAPQKGKPLFCRIPFREVECGIDHRHPNEHNECIMSDQPRIREKLARYEAMGVYTSLWFPFLDGENEEEAWAGLQD